MRASKEGIQLRPTSNAVEAQHQHLEVRPRLTLVPQPRANRRRTTDRRWAVAMALLTGVFAVVLVAFVLMPAIGTVVANSAEAWSQQGP